MSWFGGITTGAPPASAYDSCTSGVLLSNVSTAIAAVFAWHFSQSPPGVAAHVLLLAEWDVMIAVIAIALGTSRSQRDTRWPWHMFRALLVVTCTLQIYLYTLDAVSNASWGRNITGHVVAAFAGTVWSGQEPFPVGRAGITAFALGALTLMATIVWTCRRAIDHALEPWKPTSRRAFGAALLIAAIMSILFGTTLAWAVDARESPGRGQ